MQRSQTAAAPGRDLLFYLFGPALVVAGVAAWFAVRPWPVPVPGMAEEFGLAPVATSLALGAVGVWLSSRVGLPSAPALNDARSWTRLLVATVGLGLLFVAASAVIDRTMGLERVGAQAMGRPTINVPFPASIAHYLAGGILQECLFRMGPVPILAWIVGKLAFRDGAKPAVFWTVAILASLVEPVVQSAMLFRLRPDLALISGGIEILGNIAWVMLYRRFGWPALLVTRIVIELGWHVVWPALIA